MFTAGHEFAIGHEYTNGDEITTEHIHITFNTGHEFHPIQEGKNISPPRTFGLCQLWLVRVDVPRVTMMAERP